MFIRYLTPTMGVAMVALVMTSGACACDGRAAEPSASPDRATQTTTTRQAKRSATPAAASSSTRVSTAKPRPSTIRIGDRCIKETPAEPEREVTGPNPNPRCPIDPGPVPTLSSKTLTITGADGPRTVEAEIVEQDKERQRGLMYRTSMAENAGMLFIFEKERELTFWMHNTCIPLDMIFIASDGTIVGIEENTPTLTDDSFSAGCPGRYVLEVNAGWTRKNGIRAGMKVDIPS